MEDSTVNIFSTELRSKIRKDVPFLPNAFVEFWDDVTMDMLIKAQEIQQSKNISQGFDLLINQIANWNFADANGKLPITTESLRRLPSKLVTWLFEAQGQVLNEKNIEDAASKKNFPKDLSKA